MIGGTATAMKSGSGANSTRPATRASASLHHLEHGQAAGAADFGARTPPPAIMLSFGDMRPHAPKIKAAGALLICQVQTLEHARDALGQWRGYSRRPGRQGRRTWRFPQHMSLRPSCRRCGEQRSGRRRRQHGRRRGLAAALMLGRWRVDRDAIYASQEAAGFAAAKERIVASFGDHHPTRDLFDIARRNMRPSPFCGRVLRNEFSGGSARARDRIAATPGQGAALYTEGAKRGDFRIAAVIAGEAVDSDRRRSLGPANCRAHRR